MSPGVGGVPHHRPPAGSGGQLLEAAESVAVRQSRAGSAAAPSSAHVFRRFADACSSPLYARIASAVSQSPEALRALEAAPARRRHPTVVLAALHDLARRAGAEAAGSIDVGCRAALNLDVDRLDLGYDRQSLGDPSSPLRLTSSLRGARRVPTRPLPRIVARVGVDRDPLDVTDADDARWLRACVPPEQLERRATLLPDAVGQVAVGALPVVTTTWVLSASRGGPPALPAPPRAGRSGPTRGVGVRGGGQRRAGGPESRRPPRLRPQHRRRRAARRLGSAGRRGRPLLGSGEPAGVAG